MSFLLMVACHDTTLHQIAGSVLILFEHPDQLRELQADWGLAESAVQELLRYLSFAQISKPRYAIEDVTFWGRPIRRGQMIFACLAAANSDPAVFEHPEQLNLRREPNPHVAFGDGAHYCLGPALARAEIEIALRRPVTRLPHHEPAAPPSRVQLARR